MKKFIKTALVLVILVLTSSAFAQRIAVLNFNAGSGVKQSEVDGLSAVFNTYFSPKGAEIVERTRVDRLLQEQKFQKSKFTNTDMVALGEMLNVSLIVVGDVNIVMEQYNVDVRVVNTQTGTIVAKDGASYMKGGSYREMMQQLGERISKSLESEIENIKNKSVANSGNAIPKSMTTAITEDNSKRERNDVDELYGYLLVYPEELGVFHSKPNDLIKQINNQIKYGYNNWRLPTQVELDLLSSNGYLSGQKYMSSSDNNGVLLLVATKPPKKIKLPTARQEMSLHAGIGYCHVDANLIYDKLIFPLSFKYKYKPSFKYDIRLLGEIGTDFYFLPILVGINYEKRFSNHWSFWTDLGIGLNICLLQEREQLLLPLSLLL